MIELIYEGDKSMQETIELKKRTNKQLQMPLILYSFFLGSIIIDVGGSFGLKYFVSICIFLYIAISALYSKLKISFSNIIIEVLLFLIAPLFYFFLSVGPFSVQPTMALRELTPFATWLLYPLLLQVVNRDKIISCFTTALFCGAVLIIVMFCIIYIFHMVNHSQYIHMINLIANKYRIGYLGYNPNVNIFIPNVYFRWTLLLIPAAVLLLNNGYLRLIIVISATLLTISTAAIIFMFLGLACVLFGSLLTKGILSKRYMKYVMLIGCLVLFISLLMFLCDYQVILTYIMSKLGRSSSSTMIKIGHIKTVLDLVFKDVVTFLFGMGVGSSFYSYGVNQMVSNIEVSHFNLIRQYGVLYSICFFSYVFMVFVSLLKTDRNGKLLSIGLAMLFLAAGTNPLLLSPVYFLVLIISRAYVVLYAKEKSYLKNCLYKYNVQ